MPQDLRDGTCGVAGNTSKSLAIILCRTLFFFLLVLAHTSV
jgi:hypothetical protein